MAKELKESYQHIEDNFNELKQDLIERKGDIKTFDDLIEHIKFIQKNMNTSYVMAPTAIGNASAAVAFYLAKEFGITGYQAGTAMWEFIREWLFSNNKCGLRIIDYDDMLYPQYFDEFENQHIAKDTWEAVKKEAENRLKTRDACESVIKHWQSIIDGIVPFGCVVDE